MENDAVMVHSRKLFHLVRTTGSKALGVRESNSQSHGLPSHDLEQWVENFESHRSWYSLSEPLTDIPINVQWSDRTNSSAEP